MTGLAHRENAGFAPDIFAWLDGPFVSPRPVAAQTMRMEEHAAAGGTWSGHSCPAWTQQAHAHQAQTIIAAAILRHLHAVITTGQAWDPATAAHGTRPPNRALAA